MYNTLCALSETTQNSCRVEAVVPILQMAKLEEEQMINQQLYPAVKGSHRTSFAGHFCCISDSELSTCFDLGWETLLTHFFYR